ncbi:uncharacterized protein ymp isoform X4 [Drosophila bipectinata]|uniref:uncharacterized protein ymp isoform X4 n=1 Tax=Drosophila bipectinata TaxID=42026 RepID=UPI0038B32A9A
MALRLMTVAFRRRAPLLAVPRAMIARPPMVRTYFVRKNLTPFFDRPSIIFSKDAVMHHWGAVPIIVISLLAFTTEVIFWFLIAFSRHDVDYTKNSAHCRMVETRQGVHYPAEYRKFLRFHQECKTPKGLVRAFQGDTAGPDLETLFLCSL